MLLNSLEFLSFWFICSLHFASLVEVESFLSIFLEIIRHRQERLKRGLSAVSNYHRRHCIAGNASVLAWHTRKNSAEPVMYPPLIYQKIHTFSVWLQKMILFFVVHFSYLPFDPLSSSSSLEHCSEFFIFCRYITTLLPCVHSIKKLYYVLCCYWLLLPLDAALLVSALVVHYIEELVKLTELLSFNSCPQK